jgi:hypothetical protein
MQQKTLVMGTHGGLAWEEHLAPGAPNPSPPGSRGEQGCGFQETVKINKAAFGGQVGSCSPFPLERRRGHS